MGVYTARRSRDRSLLVYMCALPIELPRAYPLPAVPSVPHFSEQVIGMDLQSNPFGRSAVLHSELMQPPPRHYSVLPGLWAATHQRLSLPRTSLNPDYRLNCPQTQIFKTLETGKGGKEKQRKRESPLSLRGRDSN